MSEYTNPVLRGAIDPETWDSNELRYSVYVGWTLYQPDGNVTCISDGEAECLRRIWGRHYAGSIKSAGDIITEPVHRAALRFLDVHARIAKERDEKEYQTFLAKFSGRILSPIIND